jgi:putative effector of murein hydrolase LrgA (UPF0299 family)
MLTITIAERTVHDRSDWIPIILPAGAAGFGVLIVTFMAGSAPMLSIAMSATVFLATMAISWVTYYLRNRA